MDQQRGIQIALLSVQQAAGAQCRKQRQPEQRQQEQSDYKVEHAASS